MCSARKSILASLGLLPAAFGAKGCQAACDASAKCAAHHPRPRGAGSGSGAGDCCLKDTLPCPRRAGSTITSGAKKNGTAHCGNAPASSHTVCTVDYTPPTAEQLAAPYYEVPVACGGTADKLRLLPGEKEVEIRVFADHTFLEAYFQQGRIAMTVTAAIPDGSDVGFTSSADLTMKAATVYPMKSIWVTPEAVRAQPRVYG